MPRVIQKFLPEFTQEEIVCYNLLSKHQLPLRRLEIKLHVKFLEEICNRILILILLRLYDLDDLAYRMAYV